MAIYPKVAEIIADALGCDRRRSAARIFIDQEYDAESMDFS